MIAILRALLTDTATRSRTSDVYECRHCGTALRATSQRCPYCGEQTDIVHYEIK